MTPTEIEKLVITVVTESQKAMRELDEVQRKVEEQDRKNIKAFKEQLEVIRRGQLGRGGRFIEDVQQGFSNATKDVNVYGLALRGLGAAYGVMKVAHLSMVNDLEEIAHQADKAGKAQADLIERMSFRQSQAFQEAGSLNVEDRAKYLEKKIEEARRDADQSRRNAEASEKRMQEARKTSGLDLGTLFGPYTETDTVSALMRSLPGFGDDLTTFNEAAKREFKELDEVARKNAKTLEEYQRLLNEIQPGGDAATQALSRFKIQMKEQIQVLAEGTKGTKALALARLENRFRLTEDQKAEAEFAHSQAEAVKDQFEMIKNMKESERHFKEKISRKEDEILSRDPVHRFRKEMEELEADLAGGMGFDVFSLGVRQAEERLKSATGASNKFRESSVNFSHSLVGSGEAADKIRRQIDVNTAKREDIPILKKIESNTRRKTTGQKVVDIKPAGVGGP